MVRPSRPLRRSRSLAGRPKVVTGKDETDGTRGSSVQATRVASLVVEGVAPMNLADVVVVAHLFGEVGGFRRDVV